MAKTKEEVEVWLKDFSKKQEERKENDQEWDFELVVPQAILDLLPEWESDTWEEIDWMIDDEGRGIIEEETLEGELEDYGVTSIDELNPIFSKRFYGTKPEEQDWWLSLEEEIQGKTGLPFEEIRDFYC